MNMINQLLLNTDSYKASHWLQYPPGTNYVSSYIEARGSTTPSTDTLFFGLQIFLKEYLCSPFRTFYWHVVDSFSRYWNIVISIIRFL